MTQVVTMYEPATQAEAEQIVKDMARRFFETDRMFTSIDVANGRMDSEP